MRRPEVGVVVGRIVVGVKEELMAFTFLVKLVTKSSAVRGEGDGGGGEERREHGKQFPRVEAEELIFVQLEGRFGC